MAKTAVMWGLAVVLCIGAVLIGNDGLSSRHEIPRLEAQARDANVSVAKRAAELEQIGKRPASPDNNSAMELAQTSLRVAKEEASSYPKLIDWNRSDALKKLAIAGGMLAAAIALAFFARKRRRAAA